MKIKELKEYIRENFDLEGYKFKNGSGGAGFQKKEEDCVCNINFAHLNYRGIYRVGWSSNIRFFKVEEIIEDALKKDKSNRGISSTISIMNTDPNYRNGMASVLFEISTEQDILEMLKTVKPFIYNKALPFFEQHKTIADLNILLNKDPYEVINICSPVISIRSQKAIVAAWLNNNPNYEQLIQIYRKQQEGLAFNHEFENVVKLLETIER